MAKFRQGKKTLDRRTVRLVRRSGRVLKGASQFLGRAEGGATVPDICLPGAAEQKVGIFLGRAHDCENLGFCLPAQVEIRWQNGRQADKMRTRTHCLPTFLAAPSNFLSLP